MSNDADVTILRELSGPMKPSDSSSGPGISGLANEFVETPKILKQRFVLEEKLGSGGMGTVYKARDLRKVEARDRQPFVAVKVLNHDFRQHPEAFMALEREASKSQTLSHPNIVSIFDFDKDGDLPFMTMEMLQGRELAQLIEQFPDGLPDEMAWSIIDGLVAGLRHAHEAGVVHADFKPGNVFVSDDNRAKILDFGIARAVQINHTGENERDDTLFDPQRLAALTPAYASLEMLQGLTPETSDDLYALGVVIYLTLTGRHPYDRLSAKEAQAEGRKVQRPKGLSRFRWQALEKCLAFERSARPQDAAQVQYAFNRVTAWQSRIGIIAAAAVVFALAINSMQDEAELTEVKQEVRATTLLDAQAVRLDALLVKPQFNTSWHNSLRAEMQTLRGLNGSESLTRGFSQRVLAVYTDAVVSEPRLTRALSRYRKGVQFGPLNQAADFLKQRLEVNIADTLAQPKPSIDYLLELEGAFSLAASEFPEYPRWAELNLAAVDVLESMVSESIELRELNLAEEALNRLSPRMFMYSVLDRLSVDLTGARDDEQESQAQAQTLVQQAQFSESLSGLFSGSCLRLDVSAVHGRYRELVQAFPSQQALGLQRVDAEMVRCVNQLRSVDQDRASKLQVDALAKFGLLPNLTALRLDSCAQTYLVGNGAQVGRRGYCIDSLGSDSQGGVLLGPKLVVIPGLDAQPDFSISKEEVSIGLLNQFCGATARCEVQQKTTLPAVAIPLNLAIAFTEWLTERTGYRYRLPTLDEWRQAVAAAADPNRNCRVQLAGVERGLAPLAVDAGQAGQYGLIHALGNVREWVMTDDAARAAGGSYQDPLDSCTTDSISDVATAGDAVTGLRILREIPRG